MLRYSDELQYGSSDELFFFRPAIEGADLSSAPDNMRVTVRSDGGEIVLESDDCTWNEDAGRLELRFDLSETQHRLARGCYAAEISFNSWDEHYAFDCAFDIVPRPWRPNVAASDLLALLPAAGYTGDSDAAMSALAGEAEEQLRLRIRSAGMIPGLIANRAALDQCLRALILSLACQRASRNAGKDGLWNKHLSWQASYESKWRELAASLRYDGDADGAATASGRDMAAVRLRP